MREMPAKIIDIVMGEESNSIWDLHAVWFEDMPEQVVSLHTDEVALVKFEDIMIRAGIEVGTIKRHRELVTKVCKEDESRDNGELS